MRSPTRSFRLLVPGTIAGLVLLVGFFQAAKADDPQTTGKFTTVLLDAGHGGKDNGGTSGSERPFQREKDLTLDTVFRIRDVLKKAGIPVILTRDADYFIELDDRVAMANKLGPGGVLISIHYNAVGSSEVRGAQTFFWHASSHGIATRIQRHLVAATGEPDIGVTRRRLRLTRNPEIPGVLCECAYLTNPVENSLAANPNYRQRIAEGIAAGIIEQYKIGDAGIPSVPEIWAPMSKATDPRL
ncbi:MAG: N-acetylmuramoyl-L-alanine amidase [Verrucomicrobia bacterium]|nr:N-acetylmuramoyl-L-alanine amidase [Verrucomicrobiota bacterium]